MVRVRLTPKYLYSLILADFQHKMKFAKLASLFVFITLAVLSLSLTSAATIFLDDFTTVPGAWTPGSWSLTSGYLESASVSGGTTSTGTRTASTTGFNSIILSFARQLVDSNNNLFEAGDELRVLVSYDGTTFLQVATYTGATNSAFVTETITNINTALANNNANFKIRFECVTNSGQELCRIDDVKLEGTAITQSSNLTASSSSAAVNVNQNATITISNTGTTTFSTITISETTNPVSGVIFSPSSFSLSGGQNQIVQARPGLTGLKFGENTINFRAESGNQVASGNFKVRKTFCSAGQSITTNLTIEGIDFSNTGEGEDTEWELLDEIEVEIDIQNNNQDDEVDVVAVLGLFDSSGNDVSDELTFLGDSREDEEQIEISIDEDNEETVSWEFKVPADLDSGDYKLAVKVYDEDAGQSRDCVDTSNNLNNDFYQTISVEQTNDEGRFVIVDEIELDTQLTCGQTVSGQFKVFNVGEDDEERVRITVLNNDLGINVVREITSDLDQGDEETLDFSMTIPATSRSGNYVLEFVTEYDYDDGSYDQEADEPTEYSIEVLGCTGNIGNPSGGLTNIAIDADLASDAKAGEELVIVATITNTGDEDADYSISARGYSEWAELTDISPQTISVDAGESEEVTLTMIVNEDAEGMQSFDLQVSEDGRVQVQEIEVELAASNVKNIFNSEGSLIWIIAAINIILIILIIVVAVRMSRR